MNTALTEPTEQQVELQILMILRELASEMATACLDAQRGTITTLNTNAAKMRQSASESGSLTPDLKQRANALSEQACRARETLLRMLEDKHLLLQERIKGTTESKVTFEEVQKDFDVAMKAIATDTEEIVTIFPEGVRVFKQQCALHRDVSNQRFEAAKKEACEKANRQFKELTGLTESARNILGGRLAKELFERLTS